MQTKYPAFLIILLTLLVMAGCSLFENEQEEKPFITCEPLPPSDQWISLGLADEAVTAIAVHPRHYGVIYAGTSQDFSSRRSGKIFKSTDCGKNWTQLWEGGSVSKILLDPKNPNIIYANPLGVIKSTDGGSTWSEIDEGLILNFTTRVHSLAIDPNNSDRVYAGTAGFGAGWLYISENGGNTWKPVPGYGDFERNEDDNHILHSGVISIVVDQNASVFASASIQTMLLKSHNHGKNWNLIIQNNEGNPVDALTLSTPDTLTGMINEAEGYFEGGLFEYSIKENSWSVVPVPDMLSMYNSNAFAIGSDYKYLSTTKGVFSLPGWKEFNEALPHTGTTTITNNGNVLYLGMGTQNEIDGGIYIRLHKSQQGE